MDETIEEIGRAEQGDAEMVDAETAEAADKEGNATTGEEQKPEDVKEPYHLGDVMPKPSDWCAKLIKTVQDNVILDFSLNLSLSLSSYRFQSTGDFLQTSTTVFEYYCIEYY